MTPGPKTLLPVDIVFHPSWWHVHAGMVFDEDFFYHPVKRVESEQRMEQVLYDHFGKHGLGENRNESLPVVGAVHNAAGFLVSEMLGCEIRYHEDTAPDVLPAASTWTRESKTSKSTLSSMLYRNCENGRLVVLASMANDNPFGVLNSPRAAPLSGVLY